MDSVAKIVELVRQPRAVAWVGAGVSIGVGFPSWPQLLDELCSACAVERTEGNDFGNLVTLAQRCRDSNEEAYEETLLHQFGEDTNRDRARPLHRHLRDLGLSAILTTNFDHLLIRDNFGPNSPVLPVKIYPRLEDHALYEGSTAIYQVHGLVERGEDGLAWPVVLTRSDFDDAYNEPGLVAGFLSRVFLQHPVLFLGVGLGLEQDHYLEAVLQQVQVQHEALADYATGPLPGRLAVIGRTTNLDDDEDQQRENARVERTASYLNDLDIEVTIYDAPISERKGGNPDHVALDDLIRETWQVIRGARPRAADEAPDLQTDFERRR